MEAILLAAIDCSFFCSGTDSLRNSSLFLIPFFFASSNIMVPKIETLALIFFAFSISRTFDTMVVFPTPGIPTMTTFLLSAKQCTKSWHYCFYLFFNKQIIVINENVHSKQKSYS